MRQAHMCDARADDLRYAMVFVETIYNVINSSVYTHKRAVIEKIERVLMTRIL